LIRERIQRDLNHAKVIHDQASLQKSRLQTIMGKARREIQDSDADKENFNKILAGAPAGIAEAERAIAKAEKAIKELELKKQWNDDVLAGIERSESAEDKRATTAALVGQGWVFDRPSGNVQIKRYGHEELISLGKSKILPGDQITTDAWGHTIVGTLNSGNSVLAIGKETHVKLESDDRDNGTVWNVYHGIIHIAPLTPQMMAVKPPLVTTPDGEVQGGADSAFDVRVNEKGVTSIVVYQGQVKFKDAKTKMIHEFNPAETNSAAVNSWWTEKWPWEEK